LLESLFRKMRILRDEMEDEEYKLRLKLAVHIFGGGVGTAVGLTMLLVFKMDPAWCLAGGGLGNGGITVCDYKVDKKGHI